MVYPLARCLLVCSFLCLSSLGCSRHGGRLPVSGSVSYRGVDIAEGSIQFTPEDLSNGKPEGAIIKNGKFAIPAASGLLPGTYVVQITAASSGSSGAGKNPGAPSGSTELLPEQFNAKSKLRAEVKAGQKNQFDFPLTD